MNTLIRYLLLAIATTTSFAQDKITISGRIIDSKNNNAFLGATVRIDDSNSYVLSDDNGYFNLDGAINKTHIVLISSAGYLTKRYPIAPTETDIDLGIIYFEEDYNLIAQMGLISLSENDIENEFNGYENTAGLLQATKDPFQQAAAFNWGSAFFRVRGLDNEQGRTMINGIIMNKVYDGRPQWGNWGGLNDATRNQDFAPGSTPSDFSFGGILGTQNITTRASHIRSGTKVGGSVANTNYNWRPFVIHSSGLNKNGWAYVISASYRGAKEGHWTGTNYDALSLFSSVEKKLNENHSLNFTAIYGQNKRGKNAPLTDEQISLKGVNYNPYWGYQGNDKRNARYKDLKEPIFFLSHYWKVNTNTTLTSTVAYQFGHIANSRLGYIDNMNPDPTNYKNMPSYYLNRIDSQYWLMSPEEFTNLPEDNDFKMETIALLNQAESVKQQFIENGQLDWNWMYTINQANNGVSKIILYEDRQEDKLLSFNSNIKSLLSDNLTFNAGINYRRLKSTNFKKAIDLLGGEVFKDIDSYQSSSKQDSDLNTPNRFISTNDKFGYLYTIYADVIDVFTQFLFDYDKFNFYIAHKSSYNAYQREGQYKNGIYPTNSLGKSDLIEFTNFGFKGGATYHFSGRQAINMNIAFYNQAPTLRNTFANARVNNAVIPDISNENIFSIDGSYILRYTRLKARLTGYLNEIKNSTQVNFYYADGIGITDANGEYLTSTGGAFVTEYLTNVNKRNIGIEFGAEYKLTQTIKINSALAIGQSLYTNMPNLKLSSDNASKTFDYGKTYLKNYKVANGPQTAISVGFEYRSPTYWWISTNMNYLNNTFTNISALRRTRNFINDPTLNQPFENLTDEQVRERLRQERLPAFTVFNLIGGKSWRLPNRTFLGFFASVNNILDNQYKTGGFEQARNANYERELLNTSSGQNTFANKYWHAYGRTYFINLYYNF